MTAPASSHESPGRSVLAAVVGVAFGATLALSLFTPIWSDEIAWKLLQARYFLDGHVNITLFPQCGAGFALAPPWFMVPARAVDAVLYANIRHPFHVRAMGVATWVIWIGLLLTALPRQLAPEFANRLRLTGLVCGYLGLGVFPLLMVLSRPEHPLLLGLTLFALAALRGPDGKSLAWDSLGALGSVALSAILFAQHPKALIFLPLIACCSHFIARRWCLRVPTFAGIGYLAAGTYSYWSERGLCPDNPVLDKAFKTQLLPASLVLSDPLSFAARLARNALMVGSYVRQPMFRRTYGGNWLPNQSLGLPSQAVDVAILAFFGLLGALIAWGVVSAIRQARDSRLVSRNLAVTLSCLVSLLALAGLQEHKSHYEATLVLPLLGLVGLLSAPSAPAGSRTSRMVTALTLLLMVLSLLSQALLWSTFLPQARRVFAHGGYVENQVHSFSPFQFEDTRRSVLQAAELCGISGPAGWRHLVVDDLTYLVFQRSYRPFLVDYVTREGEEGKPFWLAGEGLRALTMLERLGSDGVIAGCRGMPESWKSRTIQNGEFCCIPAFRSLGPEGRSRTE